MKEKRSRRRWLSSILALVMILGGINSLLSMAESPPSVSKKDYGIFKVVKVGDNGITFTSEAEYQEYLKKFNEEVQRLKGQGFAVRKIRYENQKGTMGTEPTVIYEPDENYTINGEEWKYEQSLYTKSGIKKDGLSFPRTSLMVLKKVGGSERKYTYCIDQAVGVRNTEHYVANNLENLDYMNLSESKRDELRKIIMAGFNETEKGDNYKEFQTKYGAEYTKMEAVRATQLALWLKVHGKIFGRLLYDNMFATCLIRDKGYFMLRDMNDVFGRHKWWHKFRRPELRGYLPEKIKDEKDIELERGAAYIMHNGEKIQLIGKEKWSDDPYSSHSYVAVNDELIEAIKKNVKDYESEKIQKLRDKILVEAEKEKLDDEGNQEPPEMNLTNLVLENTKGDEWKVTFDYKVEEGENFSEPNFVVSIDDAEDKNIKVIKEDGKGSFCFTSSSEKPKVKVKMAVAKTISKINSFLAKRGKKSSQTLISVGKINTKVGFEQEVEIKAENGKIYKPKHYNLSIMKVDDMDVVKGKTASGLEGATFKLVSTTQGGSFASQTAVSDDKGYVKFTHIPEGSYEIEEIKAPKGYHKLPAKAEVLIDQQGIATVVVGGKIFKSEAKNEGDTFILAFPNSKRADSVIRTKVSVNNLTGNNNEILKVTKDQIKGHNRIVDRIFYENLTSSESYRVVGEIAKTGKDNSDSGMAKIVYSKEETFKADISGNGTWEMNFEDEKVKEALETLTPDEKLVIYESVYPVNQNDNIEPILHKDLNDEAQSIVKEGEDSKIEKKKATIEFTKKGITKKFKQENSVKEFSVNSTYEGKLKEVDENEMRNEQILSGNGEKNALQTGKSLTVEMPEEGEKKIIYGPMEELRDSEMKVLTGVQFELTNLKTHKKEIFTTDVNGKFIIKDLDEGKYLLEETFIPDEYKPQNEKVKEVSEGVWKQVIDSGYEGVNRKYGFEIHVDSEGAATVDGKPISKGDIINYRNLTEITWKKIIEGIPPLPTGPKAPEIEIKEDSKVGKLITTVRMKGKESTNTEIMEISAEDFEKETSFVDTILYENLIPKESYEVKSSVYKIKNGTPVSTVPVIEKTTEFAPRTEEEARGGSFEVSFEITPALRKEAEDMEEEEYFVIYERLTSKSAKRYNKGGNDEAKYFETVSYDVDGKKEVTRQIKESGEYTGSHILKHEDSMAKEQSFKVIAPKHNLAKSKMKTLVSLENARRENEKEEVITEEDFRELTTFVDRIEYDNFVPNAIYELSAELREVEGTKVTQEIIAKAEGEFKASDSGSGETEIIFNLNDDIKKRILEGDSFVVFETATSKEEISSLNGKHIVEHKDATDKNQTFIVKKTPITPHTPFILEEPPYDPPYTPSYIPPTPEELPYDPPYMPSIISYTPPISVPSIPDLPEDLPVPPVPTLVPIPSKNIPEFDILEDDIPEGVTDAPKEKVDIPKPKKDKEVTVEDSIPKGGLALTGGLNINLVKVLSIFTLLILCLGILKFYGKKIEKDKK